MVGCDGAHSSVRKALGFGFEGSPYEEHLLQADVHVDFGGPRDHDEILAFFAPAGPLAMFPLFEDGRYRVIAFFAPGAPDLPPTLETFQRLVDERGPKGAHLSDPAWMVPFRIHSRLVAPSATATNPHSSPVTPLTSKAPPAARA